jgi:alpha-beta hydrolase superfamily lysophospholipase
VILPRSSTFYHDAGPVHGRILVREWETGPVDRGTVLILHGLGDHSARHDWAAGQVIRAGYRAVGFDWPGNGGSDGIRGDMPLVANAGGLIDAILASRGLRPTGIFAHSTGAFLVLPWLASLAKEVSGPRWVWFSSPLLRPSHRQPALKVAVAKLLAWQFPKMTLSNGVHARDCYHTGLDPFAESTFRKAGGHHRVSLRFAVSLLAEETGLLDLASGLRTDLAFLLTQGLEDPICPPAFAESLFQRLPGGRKTFLLAAGSRHEPFREPEPEAFANAVRNWLECQGV